MARMPRIVVAGEPLHVIHRGNNRQDIFQQEGGYVRFKEDMQYALEQYGCQLHAYVLMTNHFHLLLTPDKTESLSGFMQSLGRRYVRYVNHEYKRSGTLWEGRFKSSLIDSEHYLLSCYRYIEENPVRANMVASPEGYRWSSYHRNALGQSDGLITPHYGYTSLAGNVEKRQAAYRALFASRLEDKTVSVLNESAEKGEVLGSVAFHQRIEKLIGRRTVRMAHGGDRKSEEYQGL